MRQVRVTRKAKKVSDRTRGALEPLDSLVTTQEERMNETSAPRAARRQQKGHEELNNSSLYEDEEMEVSIEAIRQVDADKMAMLVGQLLAKNVSHVIIQKINAKNAFEVPMILLTETGAFAEASSDTSWKRLSSTLESNNKIYGYRVDATHNYTYRVLESFTRQEKPEGNQKEEKEYRPERLQFNSLNAQIVSNDFEDCYTKQIEKNHRNINILHLETFFNVNPVLEKTKRIFDQNGLHALLLNNLDIRIDLSLRVSLIQQTNAEEISSNTDENLILCELDCGEGLEGYNIFRKIEEVCLINSLIERGNEEPMVKREVNEIEMLWMEFEAEFAAKKKLRSIKIQEDLRECIPVDPVSTSNFHSNIQTFLTSKGLEGVLPSSMGLQSNQTEFILKRQEIDREAQPSAQQQSSSPAALPFDSASQQHLQSHDSTPQQQSEAGREDGSHGQAALQHLSSVNTSYISEECSLPETAKQVRISRYIKMSNLSLSTDPILREIAGFEDGEAEEKDDALSRWKNGEAAPRKKRKPKEQQPVNTPSIDFLTNKDGVVLSKRRELLCIDKKKRKQFKTLLKNLGLQTFRDRNAMVNTRDWRVELQLKTLLAPYYTHHEEPHLEASQSIESRLVIDLEGEGESKWANMKRSTSIREAKQAVKSYIDGSQLGEVPFESIYGSFLERECAMSPALCFLTVLHLAIENSYTLVQLPGELTFTIKRP